MNISSWKQHPSRGHISLLEHACMFNLCLVQRGFCGWQRASSSQGPGSVGWSSEPHGKDWWLGLCVLVEVREILSADLSAFQLLIILQLGKKKTTNVLLLHICLVFFSWHLWYTKYAELDIMRVVTTYYPRMWSLLLFYGLCFWDLWFPWVGIVQIKQPLLSLSVSSGQNNPVSSVQFSHSFCATELLPHLQMQV